MYCMNNLENRLGAIQFTGRGVGSFVARKILM